MRAIESLTTSDPTPLPPSSSTNLPGALLRLKETFKPTSSSKDVARGKGGERLYQGSDPSFKIDRDWDIKGLFEETALVVTQDELLETSKSKIRGSSHVVFSLPLKSLSKLNFVPSVSVTATWSGSSEKEGGKKTWKCASSEGVVGKIKENMTKMGVRGRHFTGGEVR